MVDYVDPDRKTFGEFAKLPRDQIINMLNLVKLNQTASYEDGTLLTGREAYQSYSRQSLKIFTRVGGKIIWSGNFELMLIGPKDEAWDVCFIAQYPNADAFISMVKDPDYQRIVHHRQAAVKTSRLIRLSDSEAGLGFG